MYTFSPETFILPSALMELPTNIETEYYNHKRQLEACSACAASVYCTSTCSS